MLRLLARPKTTATLPLRSIMVVRGSFHETTCCKGKDSRVAEATAGTTAGPSTSLRMTDFRWGEVCASHPSQKREGWGTRRPRVSLTSLSITVFGLAEGQPVVLLLGDRDHGEPELAEYDGAVEDCGGTDLVK